jgi:hypothetical protein
MDTFMKINVKRLVLFWCFVITLSLGVFLGWVMRSQAQANEQQGDAEYQDLLVNLVYHMGRNFGEGQTPLMQTIDVKHVGDYFGEPVYRAAGKVTGDERFYLRFRAKSHVPIEYRIGDSALFYDR